MDNMITVLLVEDDEVDVMNVKRAFKKNQIKNPLVVASNGEEALNMLRGTNGYDKLDPMPSIMLLDINMPKMNGIELLENMRKDAELKPMSVFILTTSDEEKDKFEAYNLNVAGYIVKPVSFEKFVEKVRALNNFWDLCEINEEKIIK